MKSGAKTMQKREIQKKLNNSLHFIAKRKKVNVKAKSRKKT